MAQRKTTSKPAAGQKLKVDARLKDIEREIDIEPFRFAFTQNRVIEFPNPEDLPLDHALILADVTQASKAADVKRAFTAWIGEDDANLLFKGLSPYQMGRLWGLVEEYYRAALGEPEK